MSHWQDYHARWSQLRPPLRPHPDVIAPVRTLIGNPDGPVLLLGVTPELATAFESVHAVDKSPEMIAGIWPGDTPMRHAVQGDWLHIPGPDGRFNAVVGDASPNNVSYPDEVCRLLLRVRELLAPGGRFACRVFERPAWPFTREDLLDMTTNPARINFQAFKWMFAMHLAAHTEPSVPVRRVLALFEQMFPDRDGLAARTGWPRADIDTVEVYRESPVVYCFPDRSEFLRMLPQGFSEVAFHACGGYDVAECCPILSCRKAG
jgi:SAM-dependent methyltransferase